MNCHNLYINRRGYIDNDKIITNTRILLLNPYGYRLSNDEKINILIQSYQKYLIDMYILNEVNAK